LLFFSFSFLDIQIHTEKNPPSFLADTGKSPGYCWGEYWKPKLRRGSRAGCPWETLVRNCANGCWMGGLLWMTIAKHPFPYLTFLINVPFSSWIHSWNGILRERNSAVHYWSVRST